MILLERTLPPEHPTLMGSVPSPITFSKSKTPRPMVSVRACPAPDLCDGRYKGWNHHVFIGLKVFDLIIAVAGQQIVVDVPVVYMWATVFEVRDSAKDAAIASYLLVAVPSAVILFLFGMFISAVLGSMNGYVLAR